MQVEAKLAGSSGKLLDIIMILIKFPQSVKAFETTFVSETLLIVKLFTFVKILNAFVGMKLSSMGWLNESEVVTLSVKVETCPSMVIASLADLTGVIDLIEQGPDVVWHVSTAALIVET
jgi:hypothetical protein